MKQVKKEQKQANEKYYLSQVSLKRGLIMTKKDVRKVTQGFDEDYEDPRSLKEVKIRYIEDCKDVIELLQQEIKEIKKLKK